MMHTQKLLQTICAGIIASAGVVIFLLYFPLLLGMPAIHIISQAGMLITPHMPIFSGSIAIACYGIFCAFGFQWLFPFLPGTGLLKGIAYGFVCGYFAMGCLPFILHCVGLILFQKNLPDAPGIALNSLGIITMLGYLIFGSILCLAQRPQLNTPH